MPSPDPPDGATAELATVPHDTLSGGRSSSDVGVGFGGVGGVAVRRRTRLVSFMGRWLLPERYRPECFDVQVREGPARKLENDEHEQGEEEGKEGDG